MVGQQDKLCLTANKLGQVYCGSLVGPLVSDMTFCPLTFLHYSILQ